MLKIRDEALNSESPKLQPHSASTVSFFHSLSHTSPKSLSLHTGIPFSRHHTYIIYSPVPDSLCHGTPRPPSSATLSACPQLFPTISDHHTPCPHASNHLRPHLSTPQRHPNVHCVSSHNCTTPVAGLNSD